jgi:thiamine biosynthesis lipoprotein
MNGAGEKEGNPAVRFSLQTGLLLLIGLAGLWAWFRPHTAAPPLIRSEHLMDTIVSMKVYGPPDQAAAAMAKAFQRMQAVEAMASFHKPDSDLSKLNQHRTLSPSPGFRKIMQLASEAFFLTNGHFDPTFAALHRQYGFYSGLGKLLSEAEIEAALRFSGWDRQVTIGTEAISLAPDSLIDLGGIGGGFALEEAISELRAASCPAFFLDDGGDLWMEGRKPDGTPWKVGVKDPRGDGLLAMITTEGPAAISTSGDYERFIEVNGQKLGHILNPVTGCPADFFRSVTVATHTPFAADVLSTALFAMPSAVAREYCESRGVAALFLPATGTPWVSTAGTAWFSEIAP